MKKAFLSMLMLTLLFFTVGCGNDSKETAIFDDKPDALIENYKKLAEKVNFKLSEPKTTTSGNEKICTLNFGESENNKVNLKLNANDSVASVEIIANSDSEGPAGALLSTTLLTLGINDKEAEQFAKDYLALVKETLRNFLKEGLSNPNNDKPMSMNDYIKVHCEAKKKDFKVHIQIDENQMKFDVSLAK